MLNKIICIVGATGTGKTALALDLARKQNGIIINADSRQVYKDFPLITAQPSLEEKNFCSHYLYGFLESTEKFTAGNFTELAGQCIKQAFEQGKTPILVGGTGLYLRALLDGIVEIPPVPVDIHEQFIAECQRVGSQILHQRLQGIDPDYAARIHPNDKQRILRALEVHQTTGCTFTWWHSQTGSGLPYEIERLGLDMPLANLTPRLAHRIELMLKLGAIDEAKQAFENCADKSAPAWSGIGCIELYEYLANHLSLEDAKTLWLANTRAYAKRQRTWFLADKRIKWQEIV